MNLDELTKPNDVTPGFKQDPADPKRRRKWDGEKWTLATKGPTLGERWDALPLWGRWTIGVVSVLLLFGIGGAIGSSNEGDLKSEIDDLKTKVATIENERDDAETEAASVDKEKNEIIGQAHAQAAQITGKAKSESAEASEELTKARSELKAVEGELSNTESELSGTEEEKRLSTIPGDGTFKAEVDYLPGTYRAPGGEGCYWATLNSADPYDIASNENASGPTIASITTPYFQTKGCGTWELISE